MPLLTPLVARLMRRSLRTAFRRVCWVGPMPVVPADRPVVAYANHHYFHDGFLAWLVLEEVLHRPGITWMAEWDRFPFFSAAGALPFPPDDAARRGATLRRTVKRLRADPGSAFIYFPEGRLHPPDEDVLPFSAAALTRLGRLLPPCSWLPLAVHVAWWGDERPTALLSAGAGHDAIDGGEHARLSDALTALRTTRPGAGQVVLDNRRGLDERWNFRFARPFFEPRS